jgi:hypothetical protein
MYKGKANLVGDEYKFSLKSVILQTYVLAVNTAKPRHIVDTPSAPDIYITPILYNKSFALKIPKSIESSRLSSAN